MWELLICFALAKGQAPDCSQSPTAQYASEESCYRALLITREQYKSKVFVLCRELKVVKAM